MAHHRRIDWHDRIKAVEREFVAARKAADWLLDSLTRIRVVLPPEAQIRDAMTMSENLEGTYIIRLFAAFEAGLRSYWSTLRVTDPPSRDLIDAIAARRSIPDESKESVHEVREYRNGLVHEGEGPAESVTLSAAARRLQRYFSRLPDEWG